jgi:hypothetical protein
MHYLKRIFEHGEGRPSRAAQTSDEPNGDEPEAPRPASRPKRLVRRK